MIGSEEREAVLRVMDRAMENPSALSGYKGNWSESFYGGEEVKALEKEWAEYFGVKHAIACNSATSGLWLACATVGLQPKYTQVYDDYMHEIDEVIVSPYSMTCSASVPLHFGAKPVFADIEEDYYCLDVKSIEERITRHTKAIIVVDIFGQPYNADAINALAERKGKEYGHKIYVIEDAAQAAGARHKGKYAGTLGDIGVYSLNVHKPIQCGEGGIVVTNDDELAFKLRLVLNHSEAVVNDMDRINMNNIGENSVYDLNWYDINKLVGLNLRMTELSAAIAREQLKKLAGIIKIQQEYAKYFPVKVREGCEHSYYRYAFKGNKIAVMFMDKNSKFNLKQHYVKPIYKMSLFKQLGYDQHCCPVCEKVEENIVLSWLKDMP
jgi:dTDP-4-amino-4,6-dideoxygalactose transaminase